MSAVCSYVSNNYCYEHLLYVNLQPGCTQFTLCIAFHCVSIDRTEISHEFVFLTPKMESVVTQRRIYCLLYLWSKHIKQVY